MATLLILQKILMSFNFIIIIIIIDMQKRPIGLDIFAN